MKTIPVNFLLDLDQVSYLKLKHVRSRVSEIASEFGLESTMRSPGRPALSEMSDRTTK
jgi:hypothetical protein